VSKDQFQKDILEGKFVEHAQVHENLYGTSLQALEDVSTSGKIGVLDIDIQVCIGMH
jgi:guanylate kinase